MVVDEADEVEGPSWEGVMPLSADVQYDVETARKMRRVLTLGR